MGSLDSLKTKADFDLVYRHGFYRYGKNFALYVLCQGVYQDSQAKRSAKSVQSVNEPAKDLPKILLGLSVSRKVGNAPTRNLLKRRVRMLCRESLAWLSGDPRAVSRLRLVFVAKAGIAAMSFGELRESFERTLAFILRNLHSHQNTRDSQPRVSSQAQDTRRQLRSRYGTQASESKHSRAAHQPKRSKPADSIALVKLADPNTTTMPKGADMIDLAKRESHAHS